MGKVNRRMILQGLGAGVVASGFGGCGAALAADDIMATIKARGRLIAGTEAVYPPYDMMKDGKVYGYGRDILENVSTALKVDLEYVDLPWAGVLPGLLAGKFDMVAAAVTVTPERAQKYAFTVPIGEAAPAALKRKADTQIKSVEDMSGRVVGVQLSAGSEQAATAYEQKLVASGKPPFKEMKKFVSYPEAYIALMNGTIDVVVQSKAPFSVLIKERPGIFEIVPGTIATDTWASWCTRPSDTALRDFVSTVILQLRDSGKLYALQDKWFGFQMKIPDPGYLPAGSV
jgi:polar amino acid transport system substrate-binding protein